MVGTYLLHRLITQERSSGFSVPMVVWRSFRWVLFTGFFMGEHKAAPKGFMHCDGVIAISTICRKPFILRRLGPVNDGSNVHSSPGHSQLAGRTSYEAYASPPYPPSLRLIDVQSHWRRDAVRVHLTGRELRPASEH